MMQESIARLVPIFGEDAMAKLRTSRVAVLGLGGVGGYVVEALVRGGVGGLVLVDGDTVAPSNLNRQLLADTGSIGQYKTEVAARRVAAIDPDCVVQTYTLFYDKDTADRVPLATCDYVVDAIDTVTSKVLVAKVCQEADVPLVACMSTGNKLEPAAFVFDDLYRTKVCPLCRVMRKLCRDAGIQRLTVLYSREKSLHTALGRTPASTSFVPPVAGMMLAGYVLKSLTGVWGEGQDLS